MVRWRLCKHISILTALLRFSLDKKSSKVLNFFTDFVMRQFLIHCVVKLMSFLAFHTILMIGNKSCRNYKLFFTSLKLCHQLCLLYTFWYYYWRRLSLFCKVRAEYFREETKTSNPRIREECTYRKIFL